MAHIGIEIIYDSRTAKNARTGFDQSFVVDMCLDDSIPPNFPHGEFLGAVDDVVAFEFAYSIFPEVRYLPDYSGGTIILILQSIAIKQRGKNNWRATAQYLFNINSGTGGDRGGGSQNEPTLPYTKISFTIGGGTKNIKKSIVVLETELRVGSLLPARPDYKGAIGWTQDGNIAGTEVPDSTFRLQITAYFYPQYVTMAYAMSLKKLIAGEFNTGSYNDVTYLGRPAGEISFLSVSGGGTIVDIIPLTFEFAIANNLDGVSDEHFPPLTMLGHDVLDYTFIRNFEKDAKIEIMNPEVRQIHRVRSAEDYKLIGIPGA